MGINKVAVIGAGTMGNGIAHVFAMAGYDVRLVDISEDRLAQALTTISKNLDRMVAKEKITEDEKSKAVIIFRLTQIHKMPFVMLIW